jgi:phosphoserine phosphatase
MKKNSPEKIRLVSSDLNGTLVHQHTMSDMIRIAFPDEPARYEKAKAVFAQQTSGLLSMKETFEIAGPLTKGLSLRKAIEYARSEMRFLTGFDELLSAFGRKGIYFVINSTGYTVTTEVIRAVYGTEKIHEVICNRLIFGQKGQADKAVSDNDLSALVKNYFLGRHSDKIYDELLATGEVELGIGDESQKAQQLFEIAERLDIPRTALAHIGDTMGDSRGIYETAFNGGLGIGFNYNDALKTYLEGVLRNEKLPGEILLIEAKSETSDLRRISDILLTRTAI